MNSARYSVVVEDKQLGIKREMTIGIKTQSEMQENRVNQNEQQLNGVETSPEMCLELSKAEYEHSIRRSEKLDNKVYILLTVCGFIFVMLVNAITNIEDIEVFNFGISGWIIAYDILLIVTSVLTVILLGCLIYCLSGVELKRYDSNLTYEMNLTALDKTQVARFAIFEYEIAKKHNNDLITKRFDKVNIGVKLLIGVVVLLMLLSVTGSFAKIATKEYRANLNINQERSIDDVIDEIEDDVEYIRNNLAEEGTINLKDSMPESEAETSVDSIMKETEVTGNGSE